MVRLHTTILSFNECKSKLHNNIYGFGSSHYYYLVEDLSNKKLNKGLCAKNCVPLSVNKVYGHPKREMSLQTRTYDVSCGGVVSVRESWPDRIACSLHTNLFIVEDWTAPHRRTVDKVTPCIPAHSLHTIPCGWLDVYTS